MHGWTLKIAHRRPGPAWGSALGIVLGLCTPTFVPMAQARAAATTHSIATDPGSDDSDALPYRQCVPFAREASGIRLFGDALTWWDQAEGHYARGREPKVGAVMSFSPHGAMTLGHVAMVSRIIDDRTVLLRHANWSPIDGRRGNVELDVRAVDVSPDNDWSEVRVWYAPIGDLGTTHWPVNGFIYKGKPRQSLEKPALRKAIFTSSDAPRVTQMLAPNHSTSRIDASFLQGIDSAPPTRTMLISRTSSRTAPAAMSAVPPRGDDPIGRIIAAHMKRTTR